MTFLSVGLGKSSRTVQEWLPAGPIFQACPQVSVTGHGMGSVFAGGHSPLVSTLGVRRRLLFFQLFTDYLVAQRQALVAYPRGTGRCHRRDPVAGLSAEAAL